MGADVGVVQLELGLLLLGLGGPKGVLGPLGRTHGRDVVVHARGAAVQQFLGLRRLGAHLLHLGLRLPLLRRGRVHVRLVQPRIEVEQQLPLFHQRSRLEQDLVQPVRQPRHNLHAVDCFDAAGKIVVGWRVVGGLGQHRNQKNEARKGKQSPVCKHGLSFLQDRPGPWRDHGRQGV